MKKLQERPSLENRADIRMGWVTDTSKFWSLVIIANDYWSSAWNCPLLTQGVWHLFSNLFWSSSVVIYSWFSAMAPTEVQEQRCGACAILWHTENKKLYSVLLAWICNVNAAGARTTFLLCAGKGVHQCDGLCYFRFSPRDGARNTATRLGQVKTKNRMFIGDPRSDIFIATYRLAAELKTFITTFEGKK